jgi:hypothetical protein
MSDFPRNIDEHRGNSRCKKPLAQYLWPYPNISAWRLGNWFWNSGDTKSRESLKTLTREVILASDFIPKDLDGVSWDSIDEKLASAAQGTPFEDEGWISATVNICVPTGIKQTKKKKQKSRKRTLTQGVLGENHHNFSEDNGGKIFSIESLWYRPIVAIIQDVFRNSPAAERFHFEPFQTMWQPSSEAPKERIFDELYTCDAFLQAHEKLQNSPREPGCNLPRALAAMMLWSDSTHLGQFGSASLWPVYLMFGNCSKYLRSKPTSNACNHVAYIPKVSVRYAMIIFCNSIY